MGLHAYDRIALRVEVHTAVVDLNTDLVLIELFATPRKSLLRHELQEAGLLGRVAEIPALQNAAKFFSLLEERNQCCFSGMNRRRHRGRPICLSNLTSELPRRTIAPLVP